MKKLSLVFILICIFTFLGISTASASTTLLKYGSRGSEVVTLQANLNKLGYSVGSADGIFGIKTKTGVVNFQRDHSLIVDGIVGNQTRTALATALRKQKTDGLIATAKGLIGVSYQWGGTSTTSGFDCSGFMQYVFSKNGITIPRVSRDQATVGTAVSYDNLQAGDLMFFSFTGDGTVSHVTMYIGNGQFIGCQTKTGVAIVTLNSYWQSHFVTARRVY